MDKDDKFCNRCKYYQYDLSTGLTCALTNEKPDVGESCEQFELDFEREDKLQKKAQSAQTSAPGDKLGFSWGAFGLCGIWLLGHGKVGAFFGLFLVSLIPYLGAVIAFFMALNYGFNGKQIAWEQKGYRSVKELNAGERGWEVAGVFFFVLKIVVALIAIIAVASEY